MGVQEPVAEAFAEVPATPPGVRDISGEDDLFADTENEIKTSVITFNNNFFKGVLPVIPYKGNFDFLEVQDAKDIWGLQTPAAKEKNKPCSSCVEDVKRDLKKLEDFVENYKNEKDALRAENEQLKKEVDELKKLLKQKDYDEYSGVKVSIYNQEEDRVDVLVRKKSFENIGSFNDNKLVSSKKNLPDLTNYFGIQSFAISLPKQNIQRPSKNEDLKEAEVKGRKTVAQLRREFFEKDFQSEQKTFSSRNYLEIKPEEKKDTFRSRLTIRVKPKPKIDDVISKLTSSSIGSKVVPEVSTPASLFQRFEKTRVVWENDLKERFVP